MRIGVDARNLIHNITGIGRYVLEMCHILANKGHEIFLYIPQAPQVQLPCLPKTTLKTGNSTNAFSRIYWGQFLLTKLVKEDNIDIFWGPAHRLPFHLSKSRPTVVTIHDLVWREMPETMHFGTWLNERLFMKHALRTADYIVTVSDATRHSLCRYYPFCKDKSRTIHSGTNSLIKNSSIPLSSILPFNTSYFLFVGTLEPRKNLIRLLEAYARLQPSLRENLFFVIAGGQGWKLDNLKQKIRELNIETQVYLTGYISDDELITLYQGARFLAMPSLLEGFGFPILEAHSLGIPVLTSNKSSMPEIAGDAGLLVDPLNITSISEGLCQLAENNELRASLQQKTKANAERFSWDRAAHELATLFEQALQNYKTK